MVQSMAANRVYFRLYTGKTRHENQRKIYESKNAIGPLPYCDVQLRQLYSDFLPRDAMLAWYMQ